MVCFFLYPSVKSVLGSGRVLLTSSKGFPANDENIQIVTSDGDGLR